jgi:hypothetical protein
MGFTNFSLRRAIMFRRDNHKIDGDDQPPYGLVYKPSAAEKRRKSERRGAAPLLKLSTTMVDLSLQRNQSDSVLNGMPAQSPIDSGSVPPVANLLLMPASLAPTTQSKKVENRALIDTNTEVSSRSVRATRYLVGAWTSRAKDYYARIYGRHLWSSAGILALATLAFVYGLRDHRSGPVKGSLQIPAVVEQTEKPLVPAGNVRAEKAHNDTHSAPSKSKSRRQTDYVAKDTYVYYGKNKKADH